MKFEYKGLPIDYTDSGKGKTTLLFVHGAFINKEYWTEQVKFFETGYRVVTIDLPGHGASGKERDSWSMEAFGNDVCALIDHLKLENVILIGHSMGGIIILEAIVKRPDLVKGVIGIDNFKNAGAPVPDKIQKQIDLISFMLRIDFKGTCETFVKKALVSDKTSKTIVDRIVKDFRSMDKDSGIDILTVGMNSWERERELLEKLQIRLYLVNVDYIPTNEELLGKYAASGYEVVPMKGTSHYPMIENPELFNVTLEETIRKIEI